MTDHIDVAYIFKQLEEIQKQTGYLSEAINALCAMPSGDSGDCGAPGNIAGQEKAKSLGDIVRCRETTNQKLIQFYEMVYCDLRNLDVPPVSDEREEDDSSSQSSSSQKRTADSPLSDLVSASISASKAFAEQIKNGIVMELD